MSGVAAGMAELAISDRLSEHAVKGTVGEAYFDDKTVKLYDFAFGPTSVKARDLDDEAWTEVVTMIGLVDLEASRAAPASATARDLQLSMTAGRVGLLRERLAGAKQALMMIPALEEAVVKAEKDWVEIGKKNWWEVDRDEVARLKLVLGVKRAALAAAASAVPNCKRQLDTFAERVKELRALRAEQRMSEDKNSVDFLWREVMEWRESMVSLLLASLEDDRVFD
ncbi:unnamed protein product [Zymoseptoria tritici ST99CH_1A5]|uniref:Uncharacterized protein n=2 Tax=Zymoseptoria tritici TaxID=1047171 RepID=F9XAM9_ZYMTI|nr:uncharacterized protein MYCGRDRAFT_92982 [Zymoseptoria tritici IPO323]EGP87743.1 hypothetical protein MYCGRDRAFT_92982 [Zymoseptoria tritici IPO323]SMY24170.1 unnamed protein product [Zymoseptoria tritici ST99CH_1A5]